MPSSPAASRLLRGGIPGTGGADAIQPRVPQLGRRTPRPAVQGWPHGGTEAPDPAPAGVHAAGRTDPIWIGPSWPPAGFLQNIACPLLCGSELCSVDAGKGRRRTQKYKDSIPQIAGCGQVRGGRRGNKILKKISAAVVAHRRTIDRIIKYIHLHLHRRPTLEVSTDRPGRVFMRRGKQCSKTRIWRRSMQRGCRAQRRGNRSSCRRSARCSGFARDGGRAPSRAGAVGHP